MDEMTFEDEHLDLLQNIERMIVLMDKKTGNLTDLEVVDALDYLARAYVAEGNGRSAPFARLSSGAQQVRDAVRAIADWRLGRTAATALQVPSAGSDSDVVSVREFQPKPVAVDVMVACLKRVARSVRHWNSTNGRRGYLEFVRNYVL